MIKNVVASLLMVRAHLHHHHHLPRAAPAPTYRRRLLFPVLRLRPAASASVPAAAMSTAAAAAQEVADQKRALRAEVRKALKALSPDQRASEDLAIQSTILNSSWFKASKRLCAYISCYRLREVDTSKILADVLQTNPGQEERAKDLYVPRVEDKNRNMRMLKITNMDDLVKNSMEILEPSPLDANGNDREDVLSASSPIDLILLPGQAFDRTGRRLGRGGGYYDTFLMKYQELAKEKGWSQPLLGEPCRSLKMLPCDHEIKVSSLGKRLLQKCRERLRTKDNQSDPSSDHVQTGAMCTELPFLVLWRGKPFCWSCHVYLQVLLELLDFLRSNCFTA